MRKFIKELRLINKKYLKKEAWGLFFTILYSATVFLSTIVSKYLVDDVIPAKSTDKLIFGIGIFFAGCIGQPISQFIKNNIFNYISEDITRKYRVDMYNSVIRAPMNFFDTVKTGSMTSRISNDGRIISDFLTDFFIVYVKDTILVVLICIGMISMSWSLTIVVALFFVISFVINIKLTSELSAIAQNSYASYDEVCIKIEQMTRNINLIKNNNFQYRELDVFTKIADKNFEWNIKIRRLNNLINCVGNAMVVFALATIYGLGSYMVMAGRTTIGTIIAFGLFYQNLMSPMYELMNNTISLKKIVPVIERINELTSIVPENDNVSGEKIGTFERIDFEKVSYSYDGMSKALKEVSFTLKNSELVAFIGNSGSGKSTVMKLITHMYDNYSGNILLNGKSIDEYSLIDLRNNINLITQDTELFNDTILNNIILDKEVDIDKVEEVCRLVNMHETIMSFPRQYNTVINERINLSGGEKQRIAIARALINEKAIVIMDEPTSALDKENIEYIDEVIKSLAKKSLVILITHNYDLLRGCEHVIVMNDGKVERQGTYDEFISDGVIVPSYMDFDMELEAN